MFFSIVSTNIIAAADTPTATQLVREGGIISYDQNGQPTSNPANAWVRLTKGITGGGSENNFIVNLTVETKADVVTDTTTVAADASVVLVLDVSGSMLYCQTCGGTARGGGSTTNHTRNCTHNTNSGNTGSSILANQTRLAAMKDAARDFVRDFRQGAGDAKRYVSIVTYSQNANVTRTWVDVATAQGFNNIDTYLRDLLQGSNATFTEGGMVLARNLYDRTGAHALPQDVPSKSVILFTDGEPNTYRTNIGNTAGVGQVNGTLDLQKVDGTTTRALTRDIRNGSSNRYQAEVYGISYSAPNDTDIANVMNTMLDGRNVYNTSNRTELRNAFANITREIITTTNRAATATMVTDRLHDNMIWASASTGTNYNFTNNTLSWDLSQSQYTTSGDWKTYRFTYHVTLNNLNGYVAGTENFTSRRGANTTSLAFEYNQTGQNTVKRDLTFAETSVKGFAGTLEFTKVDDAGRPIAGIGFEVQKGGVTYGAGISNGQGAVRIAGIPSGHTYDLVETNYDSALYAPRTKDATVTVSFGNVTTSGLTNGTFINDRIKYNVRYWDGSQVPPTETYFVGETVTIRGPLSDPNKEFTGWKYRNGSLTGQQATGTFTMPAHDIDIDATWVNVYNVTYHANNGTNQTQADNNNPYKANDTVIVKGALFTPVNNQVFEGWAETPDGVVKWSKGDGTETFPMPNSNKDIYAIWSNTYSVTYVSHIDSGNVPVDGNRYKAGEIAQVIRDMETVRIDDVIWTFSHWTSPDVDGNVNGGGIFVMPAKDVVLTAHWESTPVEFYRVWYNANGGTGAPTDPNLYEEGHSATVSTEIPTKLGHTFEGWDYEKTGTIYHGNNTFVMPAHDVTLWAIWSPIDYNVTYHANDGSNRTTPDNNNPYHVQDEVTVKGQLFEREGWIFKGWNTLPDGSGTVRNPDSSFNMPANDVDLYAQWEEIIWELVYDANNGSDDRSPITFHKDKERIVIVDGNPFFEPISEYTIFKGWSMDPFGNEDAEDFNITENTIIYAKWAPLYTLTYNANEGRNSRTQRDEKLYEVGEIATLKGQLFERDGYSFGGWTQIRNDRDTLLGETLTISGNTIVYAIWDRLYEVTYHSNDGTNREYQTDPYTYTAGTTVNIEEENFFGQRYVDERLRYVFQGYSFDPDANYKDVEKGTFEMPAENVDLYALWKPIWVVTYDPNTDDPDVEVPDEADYEDSSTVIIDRDGTSRRGYHFRGWYRDPAGTIPAIDFEIKEDTTIYAKWERITYTVIYDANDGSDRRTTPIVYPENTIVDVEKEDIFGRTDHTFTYWSWDPEGKEKADDTFVITKDTIIYANWEPVPPPPPPPPPPPGDEDEDNPEPRNPTITVTDGPGGTTSGGEDDDPAIPEPRTIPPPPTPRDMITMPLPEPQEIPDIPTPRDLLQFPDDPNPSTGVSVVPALVGTTATGFTIVTAHKAKRTGK